jgi:hypothetical protein
MFYTLRFIVSSTPKYGTAFSTYDAILLFQPEVDVAHYCRGFFQPGDVDNSRLAVKTYKICASDHQFKLIPVYDVIWKL